MLWNRSGNKSPNDDRDYGIQKNEMTELPKRRLADSSKAGSITWVSREIVSRAGWKAFPKWCRIRWAEVQWLVPNTTTPSFTIRTQECHISTQAETLPKTKWEPPGTSGKPFRLMTQGTRRDTIFLTLWATGTRTILWTNQWTLPLWEDQTERRFWLRTDPLQGRVGLGTDGN